MKAPVYCEKQIKDQNWKKYKKPKRCKTPFRKSQSYFWIKISDCQLKRTDFTFVPNFEIDDVTFMSAKYEYEQYFLLDESFNLIYGLS